MNRALPAELTLNQYRTIRTYLESALDILEEARHSRLFTENDEAIHSFNVNDQEILESIVIGLKAVNFGITDINNEILMSVTESLEETYEQ